MFSGIWQNSEQFGVFFKHPDWSVSLIIFGSPSRDDEEALDNSETLGELETMVLQDQRRSISISSKHVTAVKTHRTPAP